MSTPDTAPTKRSPGRPREWTEARILAALRVLMEGRSRFPTEQVIIRCGERGLRDAMQYHSPRGAACEGMRAWAAALGYNVRRYQRHSPDAELVGRPAPRHRVVQESAR